MESKTSLGYFAGLLLLLVGVSGYLVWRIFQDTDKMPELLMGVFVVTAIAALMTMLYLLAAGFKFMDLTDRTQPLGLPDGSIRAMIALILIIAFIIFGFYLYRSVGDGVSTVLEKNISADSLKNVNMNRYKNLQPQIIQVTDSTYTIQSVQKVSDEGSKLAQQLLTTIGTLVVAISSFYFGSNTVTSAISKATGGRPARTGGGLGTDDPSGSGTSDQTGGNTKINRQSKDVSGVEDKENKGRFDGDDTTTAETKTSKKSGITADIIAGQDGDQNIQAADDENMFANTAT